MTHPLPPVDAGLCMGFDVGGTKVSMLCTGSSKVQRYKTADFASMDAVLEACFTALDVRPARVVLAMAGPRDDITGAVQLTNGQWPPFYPDQAQQKYPGTTFETVNDMIGTAAGVLTEHDIDLTELKPGTTAKTGTKLILALSTGFGAAAAVWDKHTGRHVFVPSEAGHIGIQPENDAEAAYLRYLQAKHVHVSAEIALAGMSGIDSLIDYMLSEHPAAKLTAAIQHARDAERPVGAVLLEFATEGSGEDQAVAKQILDQLGGMLGSVIRDLVVSFRATGGVYLTGSYILALGQYLSTETNLVERFVHPGATHAGWIEQIPIYLVDDPHVAVKGALQLAERQPAIAERTLAYEH